MRVVTPLGCCTCMFIFVQLLRPAGHLMGDETVSGPREADGTVWGL